MRTDEVRLTLGVQLEKRVLTKPDGSREDIKLVIEEDPGFVDGMGDQLYERAKTIRGDKECFRIVNDEVVIEIPALKCPTLKELQKDWNWIRSIERDGSTEEPVTLRFATVLKSTEPRIDGETYGRRLSPLRVKGRLLGFQHRKWLLENQKKFPALMALLGKIYIDFPGIVVVDDDGDRYVPYMRQLGKQFDEYWSWLGNDFDGSDRIAVSSK